MKFQRRDRAPENSKTGCQQRGDGPFHSIYPTKSRYEKPGPEYFLPFGRLVGVLESDASAVGGNQIYISYRLP